MTYILRMRNYIKESNIFKQTKLRKYPLKYIANVFITQLCKSCFCTRELAVITLRVTDYHIIAVAQNSIRDSETTCSRADCKRTAYSTWFKILHHCLSENGISY